jgi:hypothetical protein
VIRGWTNRKQEENWQSIHGQGKGKEFLKRPSAMRAKELVNLSQNPLRIMMGLLTGHCRLNWYLLKLWLVDNPRCGRCKQAIKMDSHVLCNYVVLATLRFRHLGQHCTKPGDLRGDPHHKDTALFQSAGQLDEWAKGLCKRLKTAKVHELLYCLPLCVYSVLTFVLMLTPFLCQK